MPSLSDRPLAETAAVRMTVGSCRYAGINSETVTGRCQISGVYSID